MERVVRAFPILKGKKRSEPVRSPPRSWAYELAKPPIATAVTASPMRAGTFRTRAPVCTVINVTETGGRASAKATGESYARSGASFDRWLKDQVRDITGIDPDATPLGPPTECILDWP